MTNPFGNLSFKNVTFDSEAEKMVIALQALMTVQGVTADKKSMKSLQRLKKAMRSNPTKTYSFRETHREHTEKNDSDATVTEFPRDLPLDSISSTLVAEVLSKLGLKSVIRSYREMSNGSRVLVLRSAKLSTDTPPASSYKKYLTNAVQGISCSSASVLSSSANKEKSIVGGVLQFIV